jgi:hypothetical protein
MLFAKIAEVDAFSKMRMPDSRNGCFFQHRNADPFYQLAFYHFTDLTFGAHAGTIDAQTHL